MLWLLCAAGLLTEFNDAIDMRHEYSRVYLCRHHNAFRSLIVWLYPGHSTCDAINSELEPFGAAAASINIIGHPGKNKACIIWKEGDASERFAARTVRTQQYFLRRFVM